PSNQAGPGKKGAANPAPGRASPVPAHNLPDPVSSFIGRNKELEAIRRGLAQARWLTLVGPAGCGKTRLALEVARRGLPGFKDGIWLVELAGLTEGRLVVEAVVRALDVKELPGTSLLESLVQNLKGRELLLIMDN